MANTLKKWSPLWALFLAVTLCLGCAGHPAEPPQGHGEGTGTHHHRGPADLQEYLARLDRPERDAYQKPDEVIEALRLRPGMQIADLGSGSGYFTRRFVEAVTETGTVYAIDVEQQMLDYVKSSMNRVGHSGQRTTNVHYILAQPDSPRLPPNAVDLIFVCNVFHHLENRPAYFSNAKSAVKSGGRVAIIDFYHDQRSGDVGFPRRHLVSRATVIEEMTKAGYRLVGEHDFLERQYFLEFSPAAT